MPAPVEPAPGPRHLPAVAAALLPWTAPGPDGTVRLREAPPSDGETGDDGEAAGALAAVHAALRRPAYAPLTAALHRLDAWCTAAAGRHATAVDPRLLTPANPALFGPLLSEIAASCALAPPDTAARFARLRADQWERFLDTFLTRLTRDHPDGLPATALHAQGAETHNGGARVLRVDFADGRRLAYKPRPASGELLFLAADDSVFALLNDLPPASGPIRLPTAACTRGTGPDGPAYTWQEWIDPAPRHGPLRTAGAHTLTGPVLPPDEAEPFWHRAGSLAAVAFGLGLADLTGDNVLAGVRSGDPDGPPQLWPVDLEVFLTHPARLHGTGLLHDPTLPGTHHCGLETEARWCAAGGSPFTWQPDPDAPDGWAVHARTRPATRTHTRTVVGDAAGRTGYGPYLPALLRGMFDAWTLLCRHRRTVRDALATRLPGHVVRVLPRDTDRYAAALLRHWQLPDPLPGRDPGPAPAPDEHAQLDHGDVPYFFRAADADDSGPLLRLDPDGDGTRSLPADLPPGAHPWPPVLQAATGERLTLSGLGVALRDAAEYAFDDAPDACLGTEEANATYGVRLHLESPQEGRVSFDWPRTKRRVSYTWDATRVRLRLDDLSRPPEPLSPTVRGQLRRRLRKLDRTDAALRHPWAAGGFADTTAEDRLRRLTDAGLAWLRQVVATHGWPGRSLVGAHAAAAASRLLQHVEGDTEIDFRRHCLHLVEDAAAAGDMPRREVAYLTDTLRLAEGRPQLYGTKFQLVDGALRPLPLHDPAGVDARRAELRMEPLAEYAARLRARYPAAGEGTSP